MELLQVLEARFELANHALFCGETPARHKDIRDLQRAIQLLRALKHKMKGATMTPLESEYITQGQVLEGIRMLKLLAMDNDGSLSLWMCEDTEEPELLTFALCIDDTIFYFVGPDSVPFFVAAAHHLLLTDSANT